MYTVSDDGRVFGKNNVELTQRLNEDGYPTVTLGNKKIKRSNFRVHRLVCTLFVENSLNKPEVNHIDGNKQNNHYTNLEWCTRKEQICHAFKLGLMTGHPGSKNGRAILSETDAIEIRRLKRKGWKTSQLRDKFGVGWSTIHNLVTGNTWK